jgi:hypothetical protein
MAMSSSFVKPNRFSTVLGTLGFTAHMLGGAVSFAASRCLWDSCRLAVGERRHQTPGRDETEPDRGTFSATDCSISIIDFQ